MEPLEPGLELYRRGKFAEATNFFQSRLSMHGSPDLQIRCLLNISQCELKLKHYNKALHAAERVLGIDDSNTKGMAKKAAALVMMGNRRDARLIADRLLAMDSDNREAKLLLTSIESDERDSSEENYEAHDRIVSPSSVLDIPLSVLLKRVMMIVFGHPRVLACKRRFSTVKLV